MAADPVRAEVLVPAGAPLLDAARWVGASCHLELTLHGLLTTFLRTDAAAPVAEALWTVRAHRAETAEAWHRRLPELREFPREGFVRAPDGAPTDHLGAEADALVSIDGVVGALHALEARYLAHLDVAVGPADGPVAETLVRAAAVIAEDRLALS